VLAVPASFGRPDAATGSLGANPRQRGEVLRREEEVPGFVNYLALFSRERAATALGRQGQHTAFGIADPAARERRAVTVFLWPSCVFPATGKWPRLTRQANQHASWPLRSGRDACLARLERRPVASADVTVDMWADMTADIDADGRWMTYAELADMRGIDRQSARRLAARSKWRRQKDNQQVVRVCVPLATVATQREKQGMSADMSIVVRPLEAAIMTLREQLAAVRTDQDRERTSWAEQMAAIRTDLDRERGRADQAAAEARGLRTRLDQAEGRAEDERCRIDRAEGILDGLKERAVPGSDAVGEAAEARAAPLRQAEHDRQRRSLLARLLAAWRAK
jgi:hypothetical protein